MAMAWATNTAIIVTPTTNTELKQRGAPGARAFRSKPDRRWGVVDPGSRKSAA